MRTFSAKRFKTEELSTAEDVKLFVPEMIVEQNFVENEITEIKLTKMFKVCVESEFANDRIKE